MPVIALAGRRIDAPESPRQHFPEKNISLVRDRLRTLFEAQPVSALVCSAACGADLLALDEASRLGIPRRLVLPFNGRRFRETSVTDRPGDWGSLYDTIHAEAEVHHDVLVLPSAKDDQSAYDAVNHAILDEAARLARHLHDHVLAVLVWNGGSRGDGDLTETFRQEAQRRGFPVCALSTTDVITQKANP